jgi:hypothetical protein
MLLLEGYYVVVQGHVTGRVTQTGQQYNNTYCLVYEIVAERFASILNTVIRNLSRRHLGMSLFARSSGPNPAISMGFHGFPSPGDLPPTRKQLKTGLEVNSSGYGWRKNT